MLRALFTHAPDQLHGIFEDNIAMVLLNLLTHLPKSVHEFL